MNQLDLNIGSEVLCEGESCGRLAKVVVDPHTRRVTELVVQKGRLLRRDSIVPMALVKAATREAVSLAIEREHLGELAAYRVGDYVPVPAAQSEKLKTAEDVVQRVSPLSVLYPELLLPMVQLRTEEGVSAGEAVMIERGHDVRGRNGAIGTVDHVLIDRESGEIRLLVVDRGLFSDSVIVPMALVTGVTDDTIRTDLSEEDLDSLYHYRARDDIDVMVELKERVSGVIDAESIEMALDDGILTLSGMVADVRTKRRVEAVVRSVVGVLDVQNDLDTGTALQARVTEALSYDRRTALSNIEVAAGVGVVTLRGQVDTAEVREAAGEVAASQRGVTAVANQLVVARDDETALLRLGMLAECGVSFGENLSRALREKPATGASFAVELAETIDVVTIRADLAGVKPEDVDVQIAGNTLTLTVMVDDGAEGPRSYCRSIVLPSTVDADGVEARLDRGSLALRIPKKGSATPKKIDIQLS
jgi:HSP20 family molecular chaperone IbpA/osmotically-inducible protein OsmY/sporulation protein YlmC with PRC-barrel domain